MNKEQAQKLIKEIKPPRSRRGEGLKLRNKLTCRVSDEELIELRDIASELGLNLTGLFRLSLHQIRTQAKH